MICLAQHYRLFWLVVALHDFAGLDANEATGWPRGWAEALGVISAHSPPLILATRVASACKVCAVYGCHVLAWLRITKHVAATCCYMNSTCVHRSHS